MKYFYELIALIIIISSAALVSIEVDSLIYYLAPSFSVFFIISLYLLIGKRNPSYKNIQNNDLKILKSINVLVGFFAFSISIIYYIDMNKEILNNVFQFTTPIVIVSFIYFSYKELLANMFEIDEKTEAKNIVNSPNNN